MEKLAYQLWKKDDDSLENFKQLLLKNLSKDIGELVSELQINIADADVLPANNLAQSNYPPTPNAVIFIKVKSIRDKTNKRNEICNIGSNLQP